MTLHSDRTRPGRTRIDSTAISRGGDPARQAFLLLRTVFTVAPIVFGLDKFTNLLTDWPQYLASWIDEIVAGLVVAVVPRWGALLVAAWLAGIIVDLVTGPGFYDVALRDFGLFVGALALWRLTVRYAPARARAGRDAA